MGFFTRAAMDALMKTTHPEINRRQCWNLHPHRKSCTACKDICPYGDQIFTRPNLVKDWDPCTDCGLCVSVCRSRCISPSPEQVERDTSAADTDNDTIWIGCEKSARKNSMVRACIASLSWEALAYLALNKKIVLDLTPCGECENDLCAEQLRKELTRLVEFFGPTVFEARVTLADELEDEENDEIVLLEGSEVDLDELVTTAFVLAMDTKNLCSEDCKGLCAKCGADLNLGPCGCRPEVDPRLAALAQLLDDEN